MSKPDVSIITTCKSRGHHLRQALPSWILQTETKNRVLEILIVDYGDPGNAYRWAPLLHNLISGIHVLSDTSVFRPSHARNIGGRLAWGDYLAFIDADVILKANFITSMIESMCYAGASLAICENGKEVIGSCIVTSKAYYAVRGYGEDLTDWGYQDHDFYQRIRQKHNVITFSKDWISALPNTDIERAQNYSDRRINYTGDRNKKIARHRTSPVNKDGYGMCSYKRTFHDKPCENGFIE